MAAPFFGRADFMGRDTILVLDCIAFPIAAVLGFLAGLGVGGGSLLMLWLTMAVGMEYSAARTINLLFFRPSAFIATLFRRKQGVLQLKKILPAAICGCAAAAAFTFIGNWIDASLLEKLFGALLLLTGLRELFYRPRKPR